MKLYNVPSQQVETFEPQGDLITIYVCGITPYDTTHLGHAFTYTAFDILIRYLEWKEYSVRYVQNVTDIDDDILRKAKEVDDSWDLLGDRWTAHFIEDMKTLNVRPPDHFPRATEVISDIINTVQQLIEVGVAYEVEGNVYFHIDSWSDYGKLSHIPRDEMLAIANERGNKPDDPHKRDPLDFVLWQAQAPGEPSWESPWGAGRPGWHIECSTMASRFLGQTIDIHGGGADLIFPHHESEIAQSEPLINRDNTHNQQPFCRFWMHTAMVHHEGEKMSKSLGNLVMARDLLKSWSPDALRLYLGSYHYREEWSFDQAKLEQMDQLAHKLTEAVTISGSSEEGMTLDPVSAQSAFAEAMDNDLDTPTALKAVENLADMIIKAAGREKNVKEAQKILRSMSLIWGVRLDAKDSEERVVNGWNKYLENFVH